jgi:sec-independent protein translocase protein TatB
MELSWSELLIVGVAALVIIGPKDLPAMFRELGRFTAKLRSMGREFNRAMESAARESGVKDVTDDLRKATSAKAMGLDAVKSAADKFERWDPLKNAATPTKPLTPAPMPPTPPAVAAQTAASAVTAPVSVGPNTAALYEKKAARKAATDKATAKPETAPDTAPEPSPDVAPPAAKTPGRRRKKPVAAGGDEA